MIGIILTHKSLAYELINTTEAILGQNPNLYAFSNEMLSTEEVVSQINNLMNSIGQPEHVVIMVDLRGGNCWTIARIIAHSRSGIYVLSGVNLSMVFSFLTKKDTTAPRDLVKIMEQDAHRGIVLED